MHTLTDLGWKLPFHVTRDEDDVIHIYDQGSNRLMAFNELSQVPDHMREQETQEALDLAHAIVDKLNS